MEQDKIVIEHLNLWYGSFQALKDINLRLPANEITAFIGPSGCGKSTLLKSLNRMNDLVEGCRIEGTVTLDGEDIFSRKMDVNLLRKRVGILCRGGGAYSGSFATSSSSASPSASSNVGCGRMAASSWRAVMPLAMA